METLKRAVVSKVKNVCELMAPDYAIVYLRTGVCLTVGDSGVNISNTEADMKAGIVSGGCSFPATQVARDSAEIFGT